MEIGNWKLEISRLLQQAKNIYHYFQSHFWRAVYRWPDRQLELYGITGSNGKTTTAFVLDAILAEAHGRAHVGMLTTELFRIGERTEENKTHMTSLGARSVYRYLQRMGEAGVTHVVFEMTSHALDQHRLAGLTLDGAIITNITHEHLDYHGTMEAYMHAKKRIVNYLKPNAPIVVNVDDKWAGQLRQQLPEHIRVIELTAAAARGVKTPLPGQFNKENVLGASLLARAVGVSNDVIARGIAQVKLIPGRLEWIEVPHGARVLVDFALTPDALQRLYEYLRGEASGKLIAVFGAAGRRDRAKRPLITKLVARYADEIIITQDEPYDDPEEEIYAQLEAGLADATIPWRRIEDRRDAIAFAVKKAQPGDVVAVTGMGNFDVRMIGDTAVPWSDREVVHEIIAAQLKSE